MNLEGSCGDKKNLEVCTEFLYMLTLNINLLI